MTEDQRQELLKERTEIEKRMANAPFISRSDMIRSREITSLLATGGASTDLMKGIKPGKFQKSKRVTPFNRKRT